MDINSKLHTLVELLRQPRFVRDFRPGIIPTTYCWLSQPWFKSKSFDTILDIGANVGRFVITANAVFPDARIFAFEPLPKCYAEVEKVMAKIGTGRAMNIALGASNGESQMTANTFSPSSSMLEMTSRHKEAFPFAIGGSTVSIRMRRLDDVAAELPLGGKMLIKIDVQGYERDVIAGGRATVAKADVVLIELSFEELYEGQPLFAEVYDELRSLGFRFCGTMAQMPHPTDGRMLDADCFFLRHS